MPDRALRTLLVVAIAGTPLCLMNGVFLSHDVLPKLVVILTASACLLFALPLWLGDLLALGSTSQGNYYLLLLAAQAASLLVTTILSTQPLLSVAGSTWRRFGAAEQLAILVIAAAAAAQAARYPLWRASLFRAMSLTAGIASLYGIAQYFSLDPFLDPGLYTIQVFGGIVRPPATMGHAIYFSAWLAPVSLLALSLARGDTHRIWRRIHAAVAALAPVAILFSGSRGAVLAWLCGAILLVVRAPNMLAFGRRTALAASALTVAAALFTVSPAGANLRHRLYQWYKDPGGPRASLWRESTGLLLHHPVVGIGTETFTAEFRKIESPEMSRSYPDFFHETPHNAFLDAATAQGLTGFIILVCVFAVGWSRSPQTDAALLAIFICSLFASFSLIEFLYLWTISGICLPVSVKTPVRAHAWLNVPATLVGGAMLTLALVLAVPDAVDAQLLDAVDTKNANAAFHAFDAAQAWSLGLPGNQLWRSREMATIARLTPHSSESATAWHKAQEAAESAEAIGEDRASAAFQLAILAIPRGDLNRSETKLRETIALAPNWYKPHLLLAQVLNAMGRSVDAASEQQMGIALNSGKM